MRRSHSVEALKRIGTNALAGGYGQHVPWRDDDGSVHRVVKLDLEMDCETPYHFEMFADRDENGLQVAPYTIIGAARCRKCAACKARRSRMWMARAITEYQRGARTLHLVLTVKPEIHQLMDFELRSRLHRKGVNFDQDLTKSEVFTARARILGEEITKYIKRLRKGDSEHLSPQMRYLLIAEAHDSAETSEEMRGRPHFHGLFHEQQAGALVLGDPLKALNAGEDGEYMMRKEKINGEWKPSIFAKDDAFIRKNWKLGFTKARLCDSPAGAVYLCKYLSKSPEVRVRSSEGYGNEISVQTYEGS